MPRNPLTIPVAANGDVSFAPVGSVLPTNASSTPDAAFSALGYISDDGVSFGFSTSTEGIPAWQSRYPVRKVVTEQEITASFAVLEWTEQTLTMAFGGGTYTEDAILGTWDFTPPGADSYTEYAVIIDATDGSMEYRIVLPRVVVEELDDVTFSRGDAAALGISIAALPDSTGNAIYLYGTLPA